MTVGIIIAIMVLVSVIIMLLKHQWFITTRQKKVQCNTPIKTNRYVPLPAAGFGLVWHCSWLWTVVISTVMSSRRRLQQRNGAVERRRQPLVGSTWLELSWGGVGTEATWRRLQWKFPGSYISAQHFHFSSCANSYFELIETLRILFGASGRPVKVPCFWFSSSPLYDTLLKTCQPSPFFISLFQLNSSLARA